MKLIYAWIEEFRNIKNCGLSFTDEYIVSIENINNNSEEHIYTISVIKTNNTDKAFLNNVSNITAIVGKNGSGKTNLILALSDLHISFEKSKFIYVYKDNDDIYIECNNVVIKDCFGEVHICFPSTLPPVLCVYKTNINNSEFILMDSQKTRDENLEFILIKNNMDDMTHPYANSFYSYFNRFGLDCKKRGIYYKFQYFHQEIGRSKEVDKSFLQLRLESNRYYNIKSKKIVELVPTYYPGEKCLFDFNNNENDLFKYAFILRIIEDYLDNIRSISMEDAKPFFDELNALAEEYEKDVKALNDNLDKIVKIFVSLCEKLKEKNHINNFNTTVVCSDFIITLNELILQIPTKYFHNSMRIVIDYEDIIKYDILTDKFINFFKLYDTSEIDTEYHRILNIQLENLPDGTESLVNIFASIQKCLVQNNYIQYKNIVLVLDEPDVHLHPEWCRRFIDDLVIFLYEQFATIEFQVILTTHSPFLLSDLTSTNCIMLQVDDNGLCRINPTKTKTFGQNIFKLFRQNFFMDSTIGEYATKKINKFFAAMQPIHNEHGISNNYPDIDKVLLSLGHESIKNLQYELSLVGEDLVREKLYDMLDMCIEKGSSSNSKKARIERRLQRLQKELEGYTDNDSN